MRAFLLDTNIVSALRRPAQNQAVAEFVSVQPLSSLHLSNVTLAELRRGIERLEDAERRADLQAWLDTSIRRRFEDLILPVSEDVLLRWLLLNDSARASGHTYSQQDCLIAATAAVHQLIVVTRDETHFVKAGVPTLDPWTSSYYSPSGEKHVVTRLVSATLGSELPL